MTPNQRPRQRKGQPIGGQFAPTARSEPTVTLETPEFTDITLQIVSDIKIVARADELPTYPRKLPSPKVSFDHEGTDGVLQTYITVGDTVIIAWSTATDGIVFDFGESGQTLTAWDPSDLDDLQLWVAMVHRQIRFSTNRIANQVLKDDVKRAIVSNATGCLFHPERSPIYTSEELEKNVINRGIVRAESSLARWDGNGKQLDTSAETLHYALADLHHWADAQGIDFDEAILDAQFVHDEEVKTH